MLTTELLEALVVRLERAGRPHAIQRDGLEDPLQVRAFHLVEPEPLADETLDGPGREYLPGRLAVGEA